MGVASKRYRLEPDCILARLETDFHLLQQNCFTCSLVRSCELRRDANIGTVQHILEKEPVQGNIENCEYK